MNEMTEAEWVVAERRDPSKTYVGVDMPSVWRYKTFAMIAVLALLLSGGVLNRVYHIHDLVFVQPAHAEFGTNEDRGYASAPGQNGNDGGNKWKPITGNSKTQLTAPRTPLDALKELLGIKSTGPAKGKSSSKKDTGNNKGNGTRSDPTRGGAYD